MIGSINCVYETPCGWCSKWDKKCDRSIKPSNNANPNNTIDDYACQHQWECTGMSTVGMSYTCKKCGRKQVLPIIPDSYSFVDCLWEGEEYENY